VMGLAAFATLKGITAVLRVNTVDAVAITLSTPQDLPSLLSPVVGMAKHRLALVLGVVLGGGLIVWALMREQGRSVDVLLGGAGTGLVIVAAWWLSGRYGFVAEDPNTLQEAFVATNSGRMESFSFVAPIAHTLDWLLFYSDKSKVLTWGVVTTVGVIVGSAVVAMLTRSFRWEAFGSVEDTANHIAGGVLMGVGGVTAVGCTVGQGLSGVSTLALGSLVALSGIVLGAVLALRYQVWRMESMG
jgi:uncharacterized protein